MARIGEPSILERRQATQNVANSNAHESRAFRRAARDASRMARKSKNPMHSMMQVQIMDKAKARGIQAMGISNRDNNINQAAGQLRQFAADNRMARQGNVRQQKMAKLADRNLDDKIKSREVQEQSTSTTASTATNDTEPPHVAGTAPPEAGTVAANQGEGAGAGIQKPEGGREAPQAGAQAPQSPLDRPSGDNGITYDGKKQVKTDDGYVDQDQVSQEKITQEQAGIPAPDEAQPQTLQERRDSGDFGIKYDGEKQVKTSAGYAPEGSETLASNQLDDRQQAFVDSGGDAKFQDYISNAKNQLATEAGNKSLLERTDNDPKAMQELAPGDRLTVQRERDKRTYGLDKEKHGGAEAVRRAAERKRKDLDGSRKKILQDASDAARDIPPADPNNPTAAELHRKSRKPSEQAKIDRIAGALTPKQKLNRASDTPKSDTQRKVRKHMDEKKKKKKDQTVFKKAGGKKSETQIKIEAAMEKGAI